MSDTTALSKILLELTHIYTLQYTASHLTTMNHSPTFDCYDCR